MMKDVSGWATRLEAETTTQYVKGGQWTNVTLLHCAHRCVREFPDRIAVIDNGVESSFAQLLDRGYRLANAMFDSGLKAGDVISFQLPNWHEALVINLAAAIGGFVCNPIVPIYRDAEVKFILRNSRTRILFIPQRFRSIDYAAMIGRIKADLPDLTNVILLRSEGAGNDSFSSWLERADTSARKFPPADPNAVKLLLYTSGTTGEPKGVLHSHNTLRSDIDASIAFWSLTAEDTVLMPSPVTHITGYLYGLEMPFALGATAVLMERWDVAEAVNLIDRHGVTYSVGATPFLVELVSEVERRGTSSPSLRLYVSGGAPVPPEVVHRARTFLPNCSTVRAYGCSEGPTISLGVRKGDPLELGAFTDGCVYNHEVRIVHETTGAILREPGMVGEILIRGPEVMLGYTNPEHDANAFDEEGFFRTGDLGSLTQDGYITISGRKKDLIIRGGENISAKEVEDALHVHPAVLEASVVAMPHARLGETPCAFVVLRVGGQLSFDEMKAFLEKSMLARQKIPERLLIVDDMPRTSSGKVLKHVLRAQVALDFAGTPPKQTPVAT